MYELWGWYISDPSGVFVTVLHRSASLYAIFFASLGFFQTLIFNVWSYILYYFPLWQVATEIVHTKHIGPMGTCHIAAFCANVQHEIVPLWTKWVSFVTYLSVTPFVHHSVSVTGTQTHRNRDHQNYSAKNKNDNFQTLEFSFFVCSWENSPSRSRHSVQCKCNALTGPTSALCTSSLVQKPHFLSLPWQWHSCQHVACTAALM